MSTLLVLAAAEDAPSRTEAARLLALAPALGRPARALLHAADGWRAGPADGGLPSGDSPAEPVAPTVDGGELLVVLPEDRGHAVALERAAAALPWPRVGASPEAREVADDRLLTKLAVSRLGARCAGHEEVGETHRPFWTIEQRVGLPCVVKPVRRRSALAWQRADDQPSLRQAVARAREAAPDGRCLVEAWLPGAPLALTLLPRPDGPPRILPLVALDPASDPRPSAGQLTELASLARGLAAALDLGGLALLEVVLPADDRRPAVLGLQVEPSLAPGSPAALAGAAGGLSETDLLGARWGPPS